MHTSYGMRNCQAHVLKWEYIKVDVIMLHIKSRTHTAHIYLETVGVLIFSLEVSGGCPRVWEKKLAHLLWHAELPGTRDEMRGK